MPEVAYGTPDPERRESIRNRLLEIRAAGVQAPSAPANERTYCAMFDYGSGERVLIGPLLAGDMVLNASVVIETAFDDPATILALGTRSAPGRILAAADITPTLSSTYGSDEIVPILVPDMLMLQVSAGSSTRGCGRALVSVRKA